MVLFDLEKIVRDDPNGQTIAASISAVPKHLPNHIPFRDIKQLIDKVMPLVAKLEHQTVIFNAIECLICAIPEDHLYFLVYSPDYINLLAKLPGGHSFTTVHWNVKKPNTYDYHMSSLHARRKIPKSYQYTVKRNEEWSALLKFARGLGAFGCSHGVGEYRCDVTFYFTDQVDEIMARLSL